MEIDKENWYVTNKGTDMWCKDCENITPIPIAPHPVTIGKNIYKTMRFFAIQRNFTGGRFLIRPLIWNLARFFDKENDKEFYGRKRIPIPQRAVRLAGRKEFYGWKILLISFSNKGNDKVL